MVADYETGYNPQLLMPRPFLHCLPVGNAMPRNWISFDSLTVNKTHLQSPMSKSQFSSLSWQRFNEAPQ